MAQKTRQMRVEAVPENDRATLIGLYEARERARMFAERAEVELHAGIAEVVADGSSIRDVAATLGVPHQSLHGWLRRSNG